MKGNYVILDTETGGLDPNKHSLLTIGVILIKDGEIWNSCEFKLKHDCYNVNPEALSINKIDLTNHNKEALIKENIIAELRYMMLSPYGVHDIKPEIIGHNVNFDVGFVREQLFGSKEEMDKYFSYRYTDTAGISRFLKDCGKINPKNNSLDSLIEYFGVGSSDDEDRHTAMGDCLKTWKVYKKLVEAVKGVENE